MMSNGENVNDVSARDPAAPVHIAIPEDANSLRISHILEPQVRRSSERYLCGSHKQPSELTWILTILIILLAFPFVEFLRDVKSIKEDLRSMRATIEKAVEMSAAVPKPQPGGLSQ